MLQSVQAYTDYTTCPPPPALCSCFLIIWDADSSSSHRICCQTKKQKQWLFGNISSLKLTANTEPGSVNEGKGVGYVTEKLEVCILWPAALRQDQSCSITPTDWMYKTAPWYISNRSKLLKLAYVVLKVNSYFTSLIWSCGCWKCSVCISSILIQRCADGVHNSCKTLVTPANIGVVTSTCVWWGNVTNLATPHRHYNNFPHQFLPWSGDAAALTAQVTYQCLLPLQNSCCVSSPKLHSCCRGTVTWRKEPSWNVYTEKSLCEDESSCGRSIRRCHCVLGDFRCWGCSFLFLSNAGRSGPEEQSTLN